MGDTKRNLRCLHAMHTVDGLCEMSGVRFESRNYSFTCMFFLEKPLHQHIEILMATLYYLIKIEERQLKTNY